MGGVRAKMIGAAAGIIAGLAASVAIVQIKGMFTPAEDYSNVNLLVEPDAIEFPGHLISDTDGAMEEMVVHFNGAEAEFVLPAYRDFFIKSSPGLKKVFVAVDKEEEFDLFTDEMRKAGVGGIERFVMVEMKFPITTWARDRFLAKTPEDPGGPSILMLPPRPEETSPARINDWFVPWKVASENPSSYRIEKTGIYFHGGDVINAGGLMFLDCNLAGKNVGTTHKDIQTFATYMERRFGKKLVVIGEPGMAIPTHHIEMYMTPLDDKRVFVGSPELGRELLEKSGAKLGQEPDFTEETVKGFANVEADLKAKGFETIRVPLVPCKEPNVYVSYNNVILETAGDKKICYMPRYGCDDLDRYAESVWAACGYEVRTIDVIKTYPLRGAIRCLVNVTRRGT